MTPHIGGATHETLFQGAEMVADETSSVRHGRALTSTSSTARQLSRE